ncbi:T6SS effector phospholipase Tle3 domain-containing protein [Pseudomonas sp. TWR3-1-1]|uniref:T6SS effector phospholipase Tle3 domain-containing protein n=1 Tax=Pseudomonas sp. TWR3-1-1 TaxID=2804633 RepID=UPI003CF6D1BC
MGEAAQMRTIVSAKAITLPGGGDVHLIAPPPKPCVTILVHGVNDLAGCYARIESGLCQGLNERLDMPETLPGGMNNPGYMRSAGYSLPSDDSGKATNPDAMYYRRKFNAADDAKPTRSVVIPFYWGFREEEAHINKTAPHGEWLDRNNNRLDKAGTKEGGQFANATTNLPDMWGKGFNGKLFGFISLDKIGGDMTHPLHSAAGRRYMVLAAMRLAMVIKIIRKRYPNDTINVVGHSQGTLLTLLAHAYLKDDGVRAADCVVMLNSPYSLFEPFTEKFQSTKGSQQTSQARIATLNGILQFIAQAPNLHPALSRVALKNCPGYGAIGGSGWTGGAGSQANIKGGKIPFNERDNRGSTYLYFTPQDQTVGLANVKGIGWQGIGDEVYGQPVRSLLPLHFHQRVFTLRKRAGEPERVGKHTPPYVYPLRLKGEGTWDDTGLPFKQKLSLVRAELEVGGKVLLTAPLLPVAAIADFKADGVVTAPGGDSPSGIYQSTDSLDPVDAAIAVSNKGWVPQDTRHARHALMSEADAFKQGRDNASIEAVLNEGKEKAHMTHVFSARAKGDGQVLVTRSETPYEARLRLQKEYNEPLSFHSAIPNNPEHSRQVLAYDVAIGAGESVDDVTFYAYLCRVADWRQDWKSTRGKANAQSDADVDLPSEDVDAYYLKESEINRSMIDSTVVYRTSGEFPVISDLMPKLIAAQTIAERDAGKSIQFGSKA